MKLKFLLKNKREIAAPSVVKSQIASASEQQPKSRKKAEASVNNKPSKTEKAMDIDQIEMLASELTPDQTTKRIKKDKGLIERTESSKIMITEDNKQLLTD